MAQWPALRKHLEAVGAPFGARFSDEDMAEMKTWRTNQTDMRACEALLFRSSGGISGPSGWRCADVWDSVVVSERTAAGLNASIAAPILKLFPHARM